MSTNPPPVPKGRPTTLVGGVFMVTAVFAACWYGLQRRQARKEELDSVTGGALPTWEYRMAQARAPAKNADRPVTSRQGDSSSSQSPLASGKPRTSSPEAIRSSDEHAFRAVPDAPQSKSGQSADPHVGPRPGPQPTPQRTREEDSQVYTKAPRYVDSYGAKKDR
ncbi:hypothetical protein BDN67DRAFT_947634 [Paxillus ammoniavirescens]|nr:hypothetical protein BDN67DRAFT_947634 [Paxillus ammoniavirescens]